MNTVVSYIKEWQQALQSEIQFLKNLAVINSLLATAGCYLQMVPIPIILKQRLHLEYLSVHPFDSSGEVWFSKGGYCLQRERSHPSS